MASVAQPLAHLFAAKSDGLKSKLTIGVDVGTTSVKAGVFDARGDRVASFAKDYEKTFPREGWVEQDPFAWTQLIQRALDDFDAQFSLKKIQSLCVCSQVNTHIFVDSNGAPLMPAIVWSDIRAKEEAEEIDKSLDSDQKKEIWGYDFTPDASFALSRAIWVARRRPDIWSRTRWILSPKDFCNFWLTGKATSDLYSSVGLAHSNGRYIAGLDRWLAGFTKRLPPLRPMQEQIGVSRLEQAPTLKATVFAGTMDAWGNFIGSGVVRSGAGALITGTSSIVGIMSAQSRAAKGVITFPPFEGRYLHAGPTQAGSDALVWFSKATGMSLSSLLAAVERRNVGAHSPIFLPHLQGERAPLWDPNARGVFVGLTHAHDIIDMALSVLEGVAYSERQVFEICRQAAGVFPQALRLSGGSSQNNYWSQLRADVLGVRLDRLRVLESGVLGAAVIASIGDETFEDFEDAAASLVNVEQQFIPRRDRKMMFEKRYGLYRDAYRGLKPVFDALAT